MPTTAVEMSLRWSDSKIAEVENAMEATPVEDFVHWTLKAELYAARGDTEAARSCIDHVLEIWYDHHAHNDHFLSETAIPALLMRHYDLVYSIFDRRYKSDWRFEIEIVEDLTPIPFVMEWEVVSRTRSIFRFDAGVYRSDSAHHIFLNWIWCYQLFDAYHKSALAVSGKTLFTFGDLAAAPGLAFSANRPDAFLVPDCFFLSKIGYKYNLATLDQNFVHWADRRPVVFWRGATTGVRRGDWRTLQRIKLCETARDCQGNDLFDVGISHIAQLDNPEWIVEIQSSGLMRSYVPSNLFGAYKYLIDIDGNSNSWEGLFLKLYTGCPVLKVASPDGFHQWYYDELKPWVNYVPVEADLVDLAENVAWLQAHDGQAELIGMRGRALARTLTYERELGRAVKTIRDSIRFFEDGRRLAGNESGHPSFEADAG